MRPTLKQNSQPKAAAINRNGVSSSTAVAKAEKKTAAKKKNGRPISRGTAEGYFLDKARRQTTGMPRKFVHVAPRHTASEIAAQLGIGPEIRATVKEILDNLEKKKRTASE